jgi:hypothetical protein
MRNGDMPVVPDLILPSRAAASGVAGPRPSVGAEAAPDTPELELAVEPLRPHATGVRSLPCPVCQAELAADVGVCPECGERLFDADLVVPVDGGRAMVQVRAASVVREPHGLAEEVSSHFPMAVAKRVLVYPLLFAFFANLLIPCRFHSTWACLVVSLVGLVGVVANLRSRSLGA